MVMSGLDYTNQQSQYTLKHKQPSHHMMKDYIACASEKYLKMW